MENVISCTVGQLPSIIEHCMSVNLPVISIGDPGIGKTEVMEQTAAKAGRQYLETIWSMMDVTDIRFPVVIKDRMQFYYNYFFPLQGNEDNFGGFQGKPIFWHMDEVTNVEPAIQKSILQLFLKGELGEKKVIPGTFIAASGNRVGNMTFSGTLSAALANRAAVVNVVPNVDDWVVWAITHDVHPLVIAYIRFRPEHLHLFKPDLFKQGEMAFPSPRSWGKHVSALMHRGVTSKKDRAVLIAGCVGTGPALEFEGFSRVWEDLPDLDRIEQTGQGKVPKEQETLLAVVEALVMRTTPKSIGPILEYIAKLPGEYQTLFAKEIKSKDVGLLTTKAYTEWAVKSADKLFG